MIRCYLIGAESLLIHCAETLLEQGHAVLGIVTAAEPLTRWAQGRAVPVIAPGAGLQDRLDQPFDYLFSITNLSVLSNEVLARAGRANINFHDGPLPRYAGLYATAWAIVRRESTHGITWHVIDGGIDEGDVLVQRLVDVSPADTSYSLNTKCYEAAIASFPALVASLDSVSPARTPQDLAARSYFGRFDRPAAAGLVDWTAPAEDIVALVRAMQFGPVDNPLTTAKLLVGGEAMVLADVEVEPAMSGAPGTVLEAGAARLIIAAGTAAVAITQLQTQAGAAVPIDRLSARLDVGQQVGSFDALTLSRATALNQETSRTESFWVRRLSEAEPFEMPGPRRSDATGPARPEHVDVALSAAATQAGADVFVAAMAAFLARLAQRDSLALGYRSADLARSVAGLEPLFAAAVPLQVAVVMDAPFARVVADVVPALERLRARGTYARDVVVRHPRLHGRPDCTQVVIDVSGTTDSAPLPSGAVTIALDAVAGTCRWQFDAAVFDAAAIHAFAHSSAVFVDAVVANGTQRVAEVPLLSPTQHDALHAWNATTRIVDGPGTVFECFAQQALATPAAIAVSAADGSLTYAALDARANQLARHLRALGVGPDVLVGLCLDRSVELVVAVLGIMKAGGAYVPLDPTYPRHRVALMLEDAAAPVVVTSAALAAQLSVRADRVVLVDAEAEAIARYPTTPVTAPAGPEHLVYTLYTSGSTGRPKGVMVEHRNVVNFFAGMDDRIGTTAGVWLSVTSLSFDISVLEMLWSLCRGFHLVVHTDKAAAVGAPPAAVSRPMDFSLMFFASGEGKDDSALDKYRLLIEAAKFGDTHGFAAVWTPERHFYAFGGLYPNPSVVSGALATITSRIGIRAGSVVSPLHNPVRIAEEWSLVDNLSNGRVGISFAAGWQPVDFVLRPENFVDRKAQMLRDIDTVRRLWRGESLTLQSPTGKDVDIRTLPRPIQPELPVWITAAGNPETFVEAAKLGAGVLTHLLGQTVAEVAEKVALYRRTWRAAGHAGEGTITLMLHTFVGTDSAAVRETVRQPMKDYLRSAVSLIKAAAWTFPTFKQKASATGKTPAEVFESEDLTPEETEALLDYAFERYYGTSGLFGTPEECVGIVRSLQAIGVDEVACLLDFGVPSAQVLDQLPLLDQVRVLIAAPPLAAVPSTALLPDRSLGEQIAHHAVTHLQCTPSQLSLILATPGDRTGLAALQTICIGGEAFPAALAADLRSATAATILNMYGPTETTIWSSTQVVQGTEGRISIGRPIANTQLHVLDAALQPVPPGATGELLIGGAGVARGYYKRPDLTAERFVSDPFTADPGARLYRTGDLARWQSDGTMDFLGRADFQVKVRGYRIELGEIEAALQVQPGVREAVVVAREDVPGDKRLVGYLTATPGAVIDAIAAREAIATVLPDYMVPTALIVLEALPLTPNGKTDRKALPAPDRAQRQRKVAFTSPENELEQVIAAVWRELLNVDEVGREDNFFDLGGHSLLTVQAHRRLGQVTSRPLALTDLFRFTTVRTLALHLSRGDDTAAADHEQSQRRADQRRAGVALRQRRRDAGRQ